MMQEHRSLIKRASAWSSEEQLDSASTKILKHLETVVQDINVLM
jgi:hypothetical protein